jgi:hypothetical protein
MLTSSRRMVCLRRTAGVFAVAGLLGGCASSSMAQGEAAAVTDPGADGDEPSVTIDDPAADDDAGADNETVEGREVPNDLDEELAAGEHTFALPVSGRNVTFTLTEPANVFALAGYADGDVRNAGFQVSRDEQYVYVMDLDLVSVYDSEGTQEWREMPADFVGWLETDEGINRWATFLAYDVDVKGWETYTVAARVTPEWTSTFDHNLDFVAHTATEQDRTILPVLADGRSTVYLFLRESHQDRWLVAIADVTDLALLREMFDIDEQALPAG